MIYLDNAATSGKKPQSVITAVNNALNNYCVNPGRSGYKTSIMASEHIFNTRKKLSEMFESEKSENVVFTLNCTAAINYLLKGLLNNGDHILISNLEHNAVARPVFSLYKDGRIEYDFFDAFSENIKSHLKEKVKPNTKMIFCTHVSNVTGKVLPIKEIGEFAHENGLLFGVDAAQSAGVLPISMKDMNIDYLCIAAHKGLFAPMGIGVLIINAKAPKSIIEGGTGTSSIDLIQPDILPEGLESGTVNLPAIFGLSAGIDFVKNKKINNIYIHEQRLCNIFKDKLKTIKNAVCYSNDINSAPVVSFNISERNSSDIAEILSDKKIAVRAGLHCAPVAHKTIGTIKSGTVRISPSVFNSEKDIMNLIYVLKNI